MRILAIVLVSLILIGCSEKVVHEETPAIPEKSQEIKIYFYYSPNCPACRMVKPYMNFLKENVKEVKFDFCNINDPKNCSKDSISIVHKYPFMYIPTVIVIANNVTILTGSHEVLRLGEILESYGIKTPEVVFENVSYSIDECISCHEERNIPPPSNFNCSYCCHKVQK